jgi:hypothetical protein
MGSPIVRTRLLAFLVVPLSACAAARAALPALEVKASQPIEYRAEFMPDREIDSV